MKPLLALLASPLFAVQISQAAEAPVTIQFNACMSLESAQRALGIDGEGKTKTTYLFESPALGLYNGKIEIRLRLKKKKAVLTAKNFGTSDDTVNALAAKGAECEYDEHGGQKSGSCKFDQEITLDQAEALIRGAPLSDTLSAQQLFLIDFQSKSSEHLNESKALGPVMDSSFDTTPKGFDGPLDLDVSVTPRGTQFLELKSKSTLTTWQAQMRTLESWLGATGVILCKDQSGVRIRKYKDLMGLN